MSNPNAGTEIPGEGKGGSSLNVDEQSKKHEDAARAKGWKPEEEWDGDADDWVPAKEFNGRQKLYDKIRDLKGEVHKQAKRFEKDMAQVSEYIAKQEKATYERAIRDLKAQRREAVAEQDLEKVDEIEQSIEELSKEKQEAETQAKEAKQAQQRGGPTPEFQDWQAKNKWFGKNQEMTADAIAFGTGYAAAHPEASQSDVLEATEKKVRKMYPEEFEAGEPKKKAASVESGSDNRQRPASKKGKVSVHDLSDDERKIMKTLIQRGALKRKAEKNGVSQEEQFLQDYAANRS